MMMNPNRDFMSSKILTEIREEMKKAFATMPNFRSLAKIFMFLEYDPTSRDQARFLSLLLALPVMGGYGRANKFLATSHSEEDLDYSESDISKEMYDVVKRLHENAIDHGFHPLRVEEWERATLGFMKSTSAAEKV